MKVRRLNNNVESFTLIEIIIVLVIVAIIGAISTPWLTSAIETARFRKAINEVVTFLRDTHLQAVLKRKDMDVTVDLEQNTLKRNDNELFYLPPEIVLKPESSDSKETVKYSFFYNGRGTGPEILLIGNDERKAVVYVDSLSGLAKSDFDREQESK